MAIANPENKSVHLFVEISVLPGQMTAFLERITRHILLIKEEAGFSSLEMYRDVDRENIVCIWEVWRDKSAWDAHMKIEHSVIWHKEAPNFIEAETIRVMSALA